MNRQRCKDSGIPPHPGQCLRHPQDVSRLLCLAEALRGAHPGSLHSKKRNRQNALPRRGIPAPARFSIHARDRIWLYRGRQSTESLQIGAGSPGQTCSRFVTKNLRIRIFIIPRNFSKKAILCPKRVFLTFRGTFGPQGSPTGTWKCSHSIRHRIPDISMHSVVT